MVRYAIVTGHSGERSLEEIRRFLPENYTADVVTVYWAEGDASHRIMIEGEDVAGWTLDGYVIPRLASGLIWAEECSEDGTPRCPSGDCWQS